MTLRPELISAAAAWVVGVVVGAMCALMAFVLVSADRLEVVTGQSSASTITNQHQSSRAGDAEQRHTLRRQ